VSGGGVPENLEEGCHAMFLDSYVISGNVPIEAVRKFLDERPAIAGLSLPVCDVTGVRARTRTRG
jgi:hypothetical protein